MAQFTTDDNVRIYYEEAGCGFPVIFAHEFGDNYETWEPQLCYFARRYRCVTYAARGYPPSDVPEDIAKYSLARVAADIGGLMDQLGVEQAHLVGLSMGSFSVLNFALANPARVRALVIGSCGAGVTTDPEQRKSRLEAVEARARVRRARLRGNGGSYGQPRRASCLQSQGSARLGRFPRAPQEALGRRLRTHAARQLPRPALSLRPG
ncbi:MAG: alpha/beta hydrolase [Betaproteobacteria bacterium]|nr:alpha/beta hydrolase [Betaproteobacteria bacterium]